jgi:glycine/D-amino acid oxidase-like deaminating enzyme
MDRRHALALTTFALAAGCRPKPRPASPAAEAPVPPDTAEMPSEPREGARLRAVEVDPTRVIRTIAGLRPYRAEGFVVRREDSGEKSIIHNYGHGGGGMTLSWGTSLQAVRLAGPVSGKHCAVVGGGVMGLSVARLLQLRGARVTIHARSLPPDTTSNVAGAQWWPFSVFDPGRRTEEFGRQFVEAARLSFDYFQRLVGPRWGVRWLPNYYLSRTPHGSGWLSGPGSALHEMQIGFRDFGPGEHVFPANHVRRFFTMMIEPSTYLGTLLAEVQGAGAEIRVHEVPDREAMLALPQDVIFNCTGLGAAALTGDTAMVPVKGQLSILMPQPGIDYNLIHGDYYMFPRADGIVLGGTYQRGETSTVPDENAARRIVAAHRDFFTAFAASQAASPPPP